MKIIAMLISIFVLPAAAFAAEPSKVSSYKCGGTEPFWNMTISPSKFAFEDFGEEKKVSIVPVKPSEAAGIKPGYVRSYVTKTKTGAPFTAVVKYNAKGCSDDMSDKLYEYDVQVIMPQRTLSGCCEPKK